MATESKDVELRVRARDYSQKTLEAVAKALDDLTKAQSDQLAGAKKGEVSAKALADSYTKIEQAVQALIGQNALTKTFEQQAQALEVAKQRVDAARLAHTEYANSLAGVEEKTKKQIAAQDKLARAVTSASTAQTNAQNRLDRTVQKLNEFGIATTDIAGAQRRMAEGVAIGNAALDRQAAALDTIEADTRAAAQATQIAADLQKKAAAEQVAALRAVSEAAAAAAAAQARNTAAAVAASQKRQDQIVAERAVAAALRASADQAEANTKEYATLARTVKSVRGNELADQLRGITSPTAVANENLAGLGANIDKLAAKVAAINGPVKDFRATMQALEATQKGAAGIAAQIDAYKRQVDVVNAAKIAYNKAKAEVAALATQMRAGGGDTAELTRKLSEADSMLKGTAKTLGAQNTALRAMRGDLKAAGVDTLNLAQSEQRLVNQTTKATGAVNALSDAYRKNGAAAESGSKGTLKFFESTRTTLSYAQRLRGEILALATAYVGVQGAINAASGALDAYSTTQKIQGQLGAAFGTDAKVIREEWDYLMQAANRIGISFQEAAPAYAKFAIAAKSFGFSGQEIRFTFEQVAKAARVAGLSGDEFEGVLKAIEQMMSKGTIQAEELRGQLGDRLPGAFTIMAKSIGVSTAELTKMMEAGSVTADSVINLARGMGEAFKPTAATTDGLAASQARFNNALFEFQLAVANSGFADAYTQLLRDLAELMKSADGQEFAKTLSSAFGSVVDALRFLIDHVDEAKTVLSLLTGLFVGKWALGAAVGVVKLVEAVAAMVAVTRTAYTVMAAGGGVMAAFGGGATAAAGGVTLLRGAVLLLVRTIPLLAGVTAAIWAASAAYDYLSNAKSKGEKAALADASSETARLAKRFPAPGSMDTPDPESGSNAGKRAAAAFDKDAAKRQDALDKARKSAQKKSAKDEIDERAGLIKDEYKLLRESATRQIGDKEELSKRLQVLDKQEKQALETDRIKFDAEHAKSGEAAANKEVSLKERVKNDLLRIQDELAKEETKLDKSASFDERKQTSLDAISHKYDKLKKTISDLSRVDKAAAADATTKLNAYIGQLQQLEGIKVTAEEIKRLDKELTDQGSLRDAQLKTQKEQYDAGLISQETFLANTAEINRRGDSAIAAAANNLQNFVDRAVAAQAGILSLTEQAEIKAKTTTAVAGASNTTSKIDDASNKAQLEAIDDLLAKRNAAEANYRAQFDLRMINEDEYAAKVNANTNAYKDQILKLNDALLEQLEIQRTQMLAEPVQNAARLAALDAQIDKQKLLGLTTANAASQADQFGRTLQGALGSGIDSTLNGVVDALTAMAEGTRSVGQGFQDMARSALGAFAQLLQQIAMAIAKQLILDAIAGGMFGGTAANAATRLGGVATQAHRGAVIGRSNSGSRRPMNPGWFVDAPRFHEGGLPGLRSDEVPSILQTGEEVLARDDPRNVLNGAARGGGGNPAGVRVVMVDDRSKVPEAMRSAEGEDVIVQTVRRNAASIKQMLR